MKLVKFTSIERDECEVIYINPKFITYVMIDNKNPNATLIGCVDNSSFRVNNKINEVIKFLTQKGGVRIIVKES